MADAGFAVTHLYGLTETYGPAVVNEWHGEWDSLSREARTARKGIFGPAPKLDGLPALPAASGTAPVAPDSILPADGGAVTPPADQPEPAQ